MRGSNVLVTVAIKYTVEYVCLLLDLITAR